MKPLHRPRRSVSYAERSLIELLRAHPAGHISISYDTLAAELNYDRRTMISVMRRLCQSGRVKIVERGRGCHPHCYQLLR